MTKENPEIFSKFMRTPVSMKNSPGKNIRLAEEIAEISAADDPLAGLIKCKCCHGAVVRVNKRHYGCAQRDRCENKLLIPRKQVEEVLVKDLSEKFLGKAIEENCAIYVAHTSIQTLALLEERKWRKR